jgi:hypothetical protein
MRRLVEHGVPVVLVAAHAAPQGQMTHSRAVLGSSCAGPQMHGIHEIFCGLPRASECPNGQLSGLRAKSGADIRRICPELPLPISGRCLPLTSSLSCRACHTTWPARLAGREGRQRPLLRGEVIDSASGQISSGGLCPDGPRRRDGGEPSDDVLDGHAWGEHGDRPRRGRGAFGGPLGDPAQCFAGRADALGPTAARPGTGRQFPRHR